ncbi:phosphoribosyltransferase-like protein [Pelagophyceae sp. CCMP2097]|nr:phosphoribosyltransferase-like protein [Pelagophyceae sp. CCMP2097]
MPATPGRMPATPGSSRAAAAAARQPVTLEAVRLQWAAELAVESRAPAMSHRMKLIAGSACTRLAEEISFRLCVPLTSTDVHRFNDGECQIQIGESLRGCNVYIIQSTAAPVNDNLMELLLLISAAKRASAKSVCAIVPYFAYGRQSHQPNKLRVPIAAADVAQMMVAMGVDRVLSIDLHCAQIQGFFGPSTPVDNLFAAPTAVSYFYTKDLVDPVVVSPDANGVARARLFQQGLAALGASVGLAVCYGDEDAMVGNVDGCDVVLVDDMIDSGRTLAGAAQTLKDKGARRIFAFVTHVLFKQDTAEAIEASALDELLVANTTQLPANHRECTHKIRQISVGRLIETAVRAIQTGTSVSELFASSLQATVLDAEHEAVGAARSGTPGSKSTSWDDDY